MIQTAATQTADRLLAHWATQAFADDYLSIEALLRTLGSGLNGNGIARTTFRNAINNLFYRKDIERQLLPSGKGWAYRINKNKNKVEAEEPSSLPVADAAEAPLVVPAEEQTVDPLKAALQRVATIMTERKLPSVVLHQVFGDTPKIEVTVQVIRERLIREVEQEFFTLNK